LQLKSYIFTELDNPPASIPQKFPVLPPFLDDLMPFLRGEGSNFSTPWRSFREKVAANAREGDGELLWGKEGVRGECVTGEMKLFFLNGRNLHHLHVRFGYFAGKNDGLG
jgi:hypothetical protein